MGVSFSFLWVTSRGEARECAGRPLLGTPCGTAPGIRFYRCAYIAPHPPGVTLIPRRPTLRGRGPVIGDLQRLVSRRVQGVQRGTLVLAHARLAKACRDWRRQVVELQGGIAPGPPQARTRGAVKQPSLRLAPGRIAASGAAGWRRCASHRAARKGGVKRMELVWHGPGGPHHPGAKRFSGRLHAMVSASLRAAATSVPSR